LHGCCSDPKFMEEIKHLKIEIATHIFPKFIRLQGDVFDSCMHSFFARTDVDAGGATDSLVQSVRWVEPGYWDDRRGLPLTIGSPGLPLYLPYIYIYIYTHTHTAALKCIWERMHPCAITPRARLLIRVRPRPSCTRASLPPAAGIF
jgi:hypothetical protein